MKFLPRIASGRLKQLLRSFPIVMVHGPRQCGKSTLVRHLFPNWKYVDLERPADFSVLNADIEGFFEAYPRQVVLDEAQCLPQLFNVLRHVVDQKSTRGRFILLGSAGPSLLRDVSQTLAGRVGLIELTPFRAVELSGTPYIRHRWFFGGYPPVKGLRAHTARVEWLENYVSTFLERDLPALGFRLAPQRLRRLWTMLTHVHGQLLNVSDLARSLAVSTHTVNHYLHLEGAQRRLGLRASGCAGCRGDRTRRCSQGEGHIRELLSQPKSKSSALRDLFRGQRRLGENVNGIRIRRSY